MKTKILLNAPSSRAVNYLEIFRSLRDDVELHVITQSNLVRWYSKQDVVSKVYDISDDYLKNRFNKNIFNFRIPSQIPLWEYVEFDRFLSRRPYEEIMSVARHHCWYFNHLLCSEKFDFILGEIAGFEHSILYWYAARIEIPFIWPMLSYWPGKFFITTGGPLGFEKYIKDISDDEKLTRSANDFHLQASDYIESMTSLAPPMVHVQDYFKRQSSLIFSFFKIITLLPRKILGLIRHLMNPPKMYLDPSPIKTFFYIWIRALHYKFFGSHAFENKVLEGEKNILYYLHFEPDLSTLVWSPYFKNQLEVITNIAFSLPNDYRLYVKEHPLSVGGRPIGYYKKILSIPNVRLLSHTIPTKSLLNNTSLVITITGTIAWEALLFCKPIITLGNVFFNSFKGVVHLSDWARLRDSIQNLVDTGPKYSRQDVIEFVSLVMASCADGDYYKTIAHSEDVRNNKLVGNEIIKFAKLAKDSL